MTDKLNRFEIGGRRLAATLIPLAVTLITCGPASAGKFQVNPVNIMMPSDRAASSVTIKNSDRAPVSVRVLTYKWTQEKGSDIRSETSDVIASPPIFTIPAGGTQLLRLGLRNRAAATAYRVVLEEIPKEKPAGTGVQVALRLDLPFYILNDGGSPRVSWTASRSPKGDLVLEARNAGTRHAQVLGIDAIDRAGKRMPLSKEMGVILPNSARQWKIGHRHELTAGDPLQLNIRSPSGEIQTNVVVDSR